MTDGTFQSPDGQSIALATEIGHIVVLDTTTQSVIATYTSHAMAARTLSWSPDSQVSSLLSAVTPPVRLPLETLSAVNKWRTHSGSSQDPTTIVSSYTTYAPVPAQAPEDAEKAP